MPSRKDTQRKSTPPEEVRKKIERLAPYVDSLFRERYGHYPESHPLSQYAQAIMDKMQAGEDKKKVLVSVTKGWEENNACALPSGRILISDRMFSFCESMEEIAFILSHELAHIEGKHLEERFKNWDAAGIFEKIGMLRSDEYEADVRAAIESGEGPFNPYGGVAFLNRLNEEEAERHGGSDIAHGSSLLRVLALNYTARVVDMPSLSHSLTPLPEELLEGAGEGLDPWGILYRRPVEYNNPQGEQLKRIAAAEGCGILSALALIGGLYRRYGETKEKAEKSHNGASLSAKMGMCFEKKIFTILLGKVDCFIGKKFPRLEEEGKEVVRALLLELCAGIPLSKMHSEGKDHLGLFKAFSKLVLEGERYALGKILREFSENFPEELIIEGSPEGLLGSVTEALKKNRGFGDEEYSLVVNVLARELKKAYGKGGIEDIDWGKIDAEASVSFAEGIPERAEVPVFIAIIDISAENLSEAGKMKVRNALFKKLGPSIEGLPAKWRGEIVEEGSPGRFAEAKRRVLKIVGGIIEQDGKEPEGQEEEFAGRWISDDNVIKEIFDRGKLHHLEEQARRESEARAFFGALEALNTEDWGVLERFLDSFWNDAGIPSEIKLEFARSIHFALSSPDVKGELEKFLNTAKKKEGFFALMRIALKIPYREEQLLVAEGASVRFKDVLSIEESAELKGILVKQDMWNDFEGKKILGGVFGESACGWVLAMPRAELFETLKKAVELVRPHEFMWDTGEIDHATEEVRVVAGYNKPLSMILGKYSFDIDDVLEADQLLTAAAYLDDYDLKSQVVKSVLTRQIPKLGAGEARELLFRDLRLRGTSLNRLREKVVNEEIVAPEDLKATMDEAVVLLSKNEQNQKKLGIAVAGNLIIDGLLRNKHEALALFLECGEDDYELRKKAYLAWDGVRRSGTAVIPLSILYERMHNMDFMTKQVLVQTLLMGKNGALSTPHGRKKTINWMLEHFVEAPHSKQEKKLVEFLRGLLGKLAEKSDVPTMYFLLSPLIMDRILVRPKKAMGWGEFLDRMAEEYKEEARKDFFGRALYRRTRKMMSGKELEMSEKGFEKDYKKRLEEDEEEIPYITKREETLHAIERGVDKNGQIPHWMDGSDEEGVEHLENAVRIIEGFSKYIEPENGENKGKRILGPVEFVRVIASHLGSPGVRFLQTLGLYVDLPHEYRGEFDKVYDSMPGQPKLSAFHTLRREWGGLNEEVRRMGAPIGGGSLLTVYDVQTAEGEREAVKVLNPNASFHTESMCELMEGVFDAMKEHRGLAVPIIRDIKAWINEDVSFENALEKDARFRKLHSGWRAEGSAYSIYVPEAHGQENKYYKREEFIDGKNLTQWDALVGEGHDMKDIISTVVKNAVVQLVDGQVHSDLHPGNIRITDDKKVCYLDRNYYIEINEADKEFILSLQSSVHDSKELAGKIVTYFSGEEDLGLQRKLARKLSDGNGDPAQLVASALVEVREAGYEVPLKVTLLLKNILSLDVLAKRAGFSGIAGAYLYGMSEE